MGAIAKATMGRDPGGSMATLQLGIVGALVGGLIGTALFGSGLQDFWSIPTWLVVLAGTALVLVIYGLVTSGSRAAAR